MFSFHKPRVYRSTEGCCICRAKSSSSRFTDSHKYEADSVKCFDLQNPRKGEICNACVLLVKRYKRLPMGSKRHWGHVVDARVGPKSTTKYKKYREDNENNNKNGNPSTSRNTTQSNKSVLSEKFSKIFKKTKKNQNTTKKDNIKRSPTTTTTATPHSWDAQHPSLSTTPDSLDSDYEDSRMGNHSSCTVVEFQTQTRASSYRSRNNTAAIMSNMCTGVRGKRQLKVGSKRRKCLPPQKNRRAIDSEPFFDDSEWQQRKACCGMIYDCPKLPGAFIVDLDNYKPCAEHLVRTEIPVVSTETFIQTTPAIIKLAPSTTLPFINSSKSTPVLKKHHLFFKRQSESFPQGDIVMNNDSSTINPIKTDATTSIPIPTIVQQSTLTATTNINNTISLPSILDGGGQQSYTANISSYNMPRPPSTNKINTITSNQNNPIVIQSTAKSQNFLHKIKADTGKIVKHSLDKINTAVRIKSHVLPDMKHLIKTIDKSFVLAKPSTSHNSGGGGCGHQQFYGVMPMTSNTLSSGSSSAGSSPASSTKFSDNSSDSGFDENMLDRKSASPSQEDTEKKMFPHIPGVHKMFLASGVQIQGQPQNVMLTANETAAKMLQNRKQQAVIKSLKQQQQINNRANALTAATVAAVPTAVKITQIVGNGSHAKMRAIYNNNATIQHENGVTTIVPASSLAATTQTAALKMNAMAPSTVTITPAPPTHINMPTTAAATTSHLALNTLNGKKLSATKTTTTTNLIGLSNNSNNCSSSNSNNGNVISNNQSNINCYGDSILGTINNININNNNNINNNASSLNQKIILLKAPTTKYNGNNSNATSAHTINLATTVGAAAAAASTIINNHANANLCKN